jgi:polygalacturonase
VKFFFTIGLSLIVPFVSLAFQLQSNDTSGWGQVPSIILSILPPQFPDKDFFITSSGALGNGTTDCTAAFASAVDSCTNAGGGRVVVPAGTYLTGPIVLKSNVNLYIAAGATVKFSTDSAKYMPVVYTRFEGVECMNFSPLIYAFEQRNIAVTGEGTLDGQAADANWWAWKNLSSADTAILNTMVANGMPVEQRIFGSGHHLRPNFFQPYRCANILVQGVTFKDSPMWGINPVLCQNVSILNVTVTASSGGSRPNTDGCDPESCTNVLVSGCYFSNGDDCIAIKSGRNADGRRVNVPCTNVIIQNCKMQDGHGGITIGSETSGGISNIFAENDTMSSANLQYALRFKSNSKRGGTLENFYYRNIYVGQVSKNVVHAELNYGGETGSYIPIMRNVFIDSLACLKALGYAISMHGLSNSPISSIAMTNSMFTNITKNTLDTQYVSGLNFTNVKLNGTPLTFVEDRLAGTNPTTFWLKQNYPNPFNPATIISYHISAAGHVKLNVYDMLGREVAALVDEEKSAGTYEVTFNGSSCASGVYLCRMQAGSFITTNKLVLEK